MRSRIPKTLSMATLLATTLTLAACGSSSNNSSGTCYQAASDLGSGLQAFSPPCDPGAGGILLTASGEVLGLTGYGFPPATSDDVAFVDGWEFKFTKMLVTFDKVRLNANPDMAPADQSQVGALVAEVDGPWAVDVHKGGPLEGKGGSGEQAVPIAAIANQNKNGNAAFDPTARYAFSFDVVAATASAKNVNLDASDVADYMDMVANGETVLFAGTATFKGTGCTSSIPGYDFTKLPPVVNFKLAFKTPTSYINCQNPDNKGTPFANEESQRGIAVAQNASTIAQATFHTDHPFWDSFVHDSPLHFDQIAAQYVGATTTPTAVLADLAAVNFTAFTDKNGAPLPWRNCVGSAYTPGSGSQMHFDSLTVQYNPSETDPSKALRGYADFMTYDQSTFGHLNSDGLAFVKRNYPSPP